MADPQRIHPIDVEAARSPPPTAPLVPPGTTKSDQRDQGFADPTHPPPPFRRTIPLSHSHPPTKKRSCCCRCFCWTFCLLLLLIVIVAAVVGILFLVFRPKLPNYSVDKMQISQFNFSGADSSLSATFDLTITARNPNEKIGIFYEGGSHISVWYTETKLCEGSMPKFFQGHRNTTVLNLPLTGKTQNANGLLTELAEQQQLTGNIPLNLKVNQPVRIKLGKLKTMKVKFSARCKLLVDSLSANDNIRIQSSSCKFKFRL